LLMVYNTIGNGTVHRVHNLYSTIMIKEGKQ